MTDGDYFLTQPYIALIAALAVMVMSMVIVWVTIHFHIPPSLILSVLIITAFITATFASMVYQIQQTPLTEILVGSLATAVGAIVAQQFGNKNPQT
jgi:ABC-type Fe3+-siderophore transport system permease subunit